MKRLPLLLAGLLGVAAAAPAQSPAPTQPSIDLRVSGQSGSPGSGSGTATVSGQVNLPPGWKITVHTLTLRYRKDGKATTVNAFLAVKGAPFKFETKLELPAGSYAVWAVIDVKDPDGREQQVSSPPQSVPIQ
jgi:uncharacterized lipoprotein YbaY